MKKKITNVITDIPNESNEYFSIYVQNNNVCVHVGYYEAELNNKQVDFLIKMLKEYKIYKGETRI